MAMEMTFLGTGAAYPSPLRGASSVVFRHEGKYWMFDCGEGTQIQLMSSGVRLGRISKVFITHLHGDHSFCDDCDDCLHPNELLGYTIECNTESESWSLYEDDQLKVVAGILRHQIPCFGYVVEEKPSIGKLDAKKLQSKGIPPGNLYAKIKAGESIESPNGEIVHPSDVLSPSQPGRKIAIFGDTCDSSKMASLCNNATVLVHESTLSNEMAESAVEKGHSTPEMAAIFACSVNAQNLVLTHFSQRYKMTSDDPENCVALLRQQAEKTFHCSDTKKLIMAEDLMVINIKKQQEQPSIIVTNPSGNTLAAPVNTVP